MRSDVQQLRSESNGEPTSSELRLRALSMLSDANARHAVLYPPLLGLLVGLFIAAELDLGLHLWFAMAFAGLAAGVFVARDVVRWKSSPPTRLLLLGIGLPCALWLARQLWGAA